MNQKITLQNTDPIKIIQPYKPQSIKSTKLPKKSRRQNNQRNETLKRKRTK